MKNFWFEKGKGWKSLIPIAWQGWVVIGVFTLLIVYNFFRLDARSHSTSDTLRPFLLQTIALVIMLLLTAKNLSKEK